MDFCISRIEHFKASDCNGVYRESARALSRYPHSDINPSFTAQNVELVSTIIDPRKSIPEQIRAIKEERGIKGRFNLTGTNPRTLTNIMSQAFFKLTSGYMDELTSEEKVNVYADCLYWFQQQYPSAIILSAYVHFDEPKAGAHLHINFLPVYDDGEKQVFSSSKLFAGADHYTKYQDRLHAWATEHFAFDFARRRPGAENAKHLSVPEYKAAMRELEEVKERLNEYVPAVQSVEEIKSIGTPVLFGSGYKVQEEELEGLKAAAIAHIQSDFAFRSLQEENSEYQARLEKERATANRLARENRIMRETLSRIKAFFTTQNLSHVWDMLIRYHRDNENQKQEKNYDKIR